MDNDSIKNNYWIILKKQIYDTIKIIEPNKIILKMLDYLFESPGKLIRPMLVLNLYKIFRNDELKIIPFAAAIEVLHNASLIHDDIQDYDQYRRKRLTIWKKFSINQAINFGDFLFALAFEIINQSKYKGKIKLKLIKLLTQTVYNLVKGQTADISSRDFTCSSFLTLENYYHIIKGKTGSIFDLIFNGIIILTNINKKDYNDFIKIGDSLGKIYQINDDIIDFIGIKDNRIKGSEIISGNYSILTILAYKNLNKNEKQSFLKLLKIKTKNKNQMKNIIEYYKKSNSLTDAVNILNSEINKLSSNKLLQNSKELMHLIKTILNILSKGNYIKI